MAREGRSSYTQITATAKQSNPWFKVKRCHGLAAHTAHTQSLGTEVPGETSLKEPKIHLWNIPATQQGGQGGHCT